MTEHRTGSYQADDRRDNSTVLKTNVDNRREERQMKVNIRCLERKRKVHI
jgi:hypothetical protein